MSEILGFLCGMAYGMLGTFVSKKLGKPEEKKIQYFWPYFLIKELIQTIKTKI